MSARAVVFEQPEALALLELELDRPGPEEAVVDVEWTGISTGTEKLLWSGRMPPFPGMGYPLVPGYETVGRVAACGEQSSFAVGDRVFVSGARCFGNVRGLFGGAASRLVVDETKLLLVGDRLEEEAILLALAATAYHALHADGEKALPQLIVGHGVLGRLLARLACVLGQDDVTVWETDARRRDGAAGYEVVDPKSDARTDYARILDASGDSAIIDTLVQRLARNGEIVLAGFYAAPLTFAFPPAFMREAAIRIVAEWMPADLKAVKRLIDSGALSLKGLISHRVSADAADSAYPTAFSDPECLKMVLDWRSA
ncbi:MAG: chlorophyll synthesis pathway protein BchC [Woeseiaceae bacterium]|nr:chlorophyll synthesis pathway protein BchC [Woeseiaceae bacterium]